MVWQQWIRAAIERAIADRRWLAVVLLLVVGGGGLILWWVFTKKIDEWATRLLEQRGPGMIHDIFLFLASETFRVLLFGSLPALLVWVCMRKAGIPTLGGMVRTTEVFTPATIHIELRSIDFSRLKLTEPILTFKIRVESVQWPLELKQINGIILSNGGEFPLPIRCQSLPLKFQELSSAYILNIDQPLSTDRAKEQIALLSAEEGMVGYSFRLKLEGTARLSRGTCPITRHLDNVVTVKGPILFNGEEPNMAMLSPLMVSQVVYDNYGKRHIKG